MAPRRPIGSSIFFFPGMSAERCIDTVRPKQILWPDTTYEAGDFILRPPTCDAAPPNEPGLVHRLQKMAGVERKRRSRTRRDPYPYSKPSRPVNPQTSVLGSLELSDTSLNTDAPPHLLTTASPYNPQFYIGRWRLNQD